MSGGPDLLCDLVVSARTYTTRKFVLARRWLSQTSHLERVSDVETDVAIVHRG